MSEAISPNYSRALEVGQIHHIIAARGQHL